MLHPQYEKMNNILGFLVLLLLLIHINLSITQEVPFPPYIVKQPPTDEVLFEQNDWSSTIECEAMAAPAPKYYWTKNGKPFAWEMYGGRIFQRPALGTLVIYNVTEADAGQYQCFAENQYGIAASNSIFLREVKLNTSETGSMIALTAREGDPIHINCERPYGYPKPKMYWVYYYSSGNFRMITRDPRISVDPEGNLWFSNLTKEDAKGDVMYVCAASSLHIYSFLSKVSLSVILSEVSASQNKREPVLQYVTRKNEIAYRGKYAELYCIFGGTPLPQTVWSKNGNLVQFSDRITQGNYGKTLIIKVVRFEDEGSYTCEVSNGVGEAKSHSINLTVQAVPYFTKEPERVTATENETAELHCKAGGIPKPEIKWIHNGKPIAEAPYNPRRKIFENKIVIEGLVKNDTGNYGCNATNNIGYIYKDVYVNVLEFK